MVLFFSLIVYRVDVLRERKLCQRRCTVAEKRGGALWRVRIHRIKPYVVILRDVKK